MSLVTLDLACLACRAAGAALLVSPSTGGREGREGSGSGGRVGTVSGRCRACVIGYRVEVGHVLGKDVLIGRWGINRLGRPDRFAGSNPEQSGVAAAGPGESRPLAETFPWFPPGPRWANFAHANRWMGFNLVRTPTLERNRR